MAIAKLENIKYSDEDYKSVLDEEYEYNSEKYATKTLLLSKLTVPAPSFLSSFFMLLSNPTLPPRFDNLKYDYSKV